MLLKNKKYHLGVIFHSKEGDEVKWIYKVEGTQCYWATFEEMHKLGAQPKKYFYRIAMEDLEALTINGYIAFMSIARN